MEQNDPRKLLISIASALERLKIPYLITGGLAVFIWGRPRFTADIDTIIELPSQKISAFEKTLKNLGEGGYLDLDMIEEAVRLRGEFNFIDWETGMKIDFWISQGDAFDQSRLQRRVPQTILGKTIYFSSPEDLILSKLRWYADTKSSRHLEDIQSVISISGAKLDIDYLRRWVTKLGLRALAVETGIKL